MYGKLDGALPMQDHPELTLGAVFDMAGWKNAAQVKAKLPYESESEGTKT